MLTIENLIIEQGQRQILEISQASASKGEFVSILGPNGAGKSSLLKTVSLEWPAQTGQLLLDGNAIAELPRHIRAKHIGMLPQSSGLSFPFTVREVVEIGATPLSLRAHALTIEVDKWLSITHTLEFADRYYLSLSGGERQRVQLARVLLQLSQAETTPLLLLDEPTSAQDLGQQHAMLSFLQALCREQGMIIIAILHDINLAARYSDKIWLLHQGKMADMGTPEEVLSPEQIKSVWGYQPEQFSHSSGHIVLV
jgi:iron complex transport system ATP-binding protein